MAWLNLRFLVPGAHAEAVADALLDLAALSVEVSDAEAGTPLEEAWFDEPGSERAPGWRLAHVDALLAEEVDISRLTAELAQQGELPEARLLGIRRVEERDWVRATQAQFMPVKIGDRLWIVPSWHEPVDTSAVNLRIDPGLAFGTGTHPTTRLCLAWLERQQLDGRQVIDYGCGSGILGIAALRLGAAAATAVDIDPQALHASAQNAAANKVELRLCAANGAPPPAADVLLANILANPLIQLAPLLIGLLRPGGELVLSGILLDQAQSVMAAYRPHLALRVDCEEDGWVCLVGRR